MDDADVDRLLAYLGKATSFTQADTLSYEERTNLKESDFALVQTVNGRKLRRFPIQDEPHRKNAWARLPQAKNLTEAERSEIANKVINKAKSAGDEWAKPYKKVNGKWTKDTKGGGASMAKYVGIPEEQEAAVDAIIAALKAELKAEQDKALASLKAEHAKALEAAETEDELAKAAAAKAELEAEKAKAVELGNQVASLTAAKDKLAADLTDRETKLAEIVDKAKLAQTIAELKADYGLTDEQLKEEKRAALVAKLAAGKEAVTPAEFKQIISGGVVVAPGKGQAPVPLFAASGGGLPDTAPDEKAIARAFPAAVPAMRRTR
jgi:hypothetical protein